MKSGLASALFSLVATVVVIEPALAEPLCALGKQNWQQNQDLPPTPVALQQMGAVNATLCAPGRYRCAFYRLFANPTSGNAQAEGGPAGNTIRYSPTFMNSVIGEFGPLATIAILAHELGHIIDFYQRPGNLPPTNREARADAIAGCAFALAGSAPGDLVPFAAVLQAMGSSPGYPTAAERVSLARQGYNLCANGGAP